MQKEDYVRCKVYYRDNGSEITIPTKSLNYPSTKRFIITESLSTKNEIVYRHKKHPEITVVAKER